jgi:hypothetical protein
LSATTVVDLYDDRVATCSGLLHFAATGWTVGRRPTFDADDSRPRGTFA